ncbi:hypothetical protein A2U01_0084759, partial [Trifolium medium]|nr:hypothetical protein [Trifolium medium]
GRSMILRDKGPWWRSSSTGEQWRRCRRGGKFLLGEFLLGCALVAYPRDAGSFEKRSRVSLG